MLDDWASTQTRQLVRKNWKKTGDSVRHVPIPDGRLDDDDDVWKWRVFILSYSSSLFTSSARQHNKEKWGKWANKYFKQNTKFDDSKKQQQTNKQTKPKFRYFFIFYSLNCCVGVAVATAAVSCLRVGILSCCSLFLFVGSMAKKRRDRRLPIGWRLIELTIVRKRGLVDRLIYSKAIRRHRLLLYFMMIGEVEHPVGCDSFDTSSDSPECTVQKIIEINQSKINRENSHHQPLFNCFGRRCFLVVELLGWWPVYRG